MPKRDTILEEAESHAESQHEDQPDDDSAPSATILEQEVVPEPEPAQDNHWGNSIWIREKRFIIGLLDTFDPSELANLEFQISTCEQGGRKLVIKDMIVRC